MSSQGKVPPPLKPKPKVPPKKPSVQNLAKSAHASSSPVKKSAVKFEQENDESQEEFIHSLKGNLRKTDRDWSSFEPKSSSRDAGETIDENPSENVPLVKSSSPSDQRKGSTTASLLSHTDGIPVGLPGMVKSRSRSNTASSIDSIQSIPEPRHHSDSHHKQPRRHQSLLSLASSKNASKDSIDSDGSGGKKGSLQNKFHKYANKSTDKLKLYTNKSTDLLQQYSTKSNDKLHQYANVSQEKYKKYSEVSQEKYKKYSEVSQEKYKKYSEVSQEKLHK
ncbi:unnamed protein product [Ambrosiozyma monospora]|uniref:Unnamed protein product n=1 Tax=Ambrosiozyma monospora TaxID=43982 RepID=A0ACB5T612_AMBMO|nr:unnamed protein product [Ambrosiozyma monospora]